MALRIAPLMRASRTTNMLWPIGNQILKTTNKQVLVLPTSKDKQPKQSKEQLFADQTGGPESCSCALLFNSAANSLKFSHVPSTELYVS